MKALLTILAILTIAPGMPKRKVRLTITVLPALLEVVRNQPVTVRVNSSTFSFDSSMIISDSLVLNLEFTNASYFYASVSGSAIYNDGSERYFMNGSKFSISSRSNEFSLKFPADCDMNRYLGGKTCPKCKNTGNVIPVFWGLPNEDMGGIPGVDFEPMGCIRSACDPAWYCKKDSLAF